LLIGGVVHAQTTRAKRRKLHYMTLAAAVRRVVAVCRARAASASSQVSSGLRGLTPLNVNHLRRAQHAGRRLPAGASTGPMSAMVISVTISGAAMRVGITYGGRHSRGKRWTASSAT